MWGDGENQLGELAAVFGSHLPPWLGFTSQMTALLGFSLEPLSERELFGIVHLAFGQRYIGSLPSRTEKCHLYLSDVRNFSSADLQLAGIKADALIYH